MFKLVSVDVETTGTNSEENQVIEVAAVIDDFKTPFEKLPRFHTYVIHKTPLVCDSFVLTMPSHHEIFRRIHFRDERFSYTYAEDVAEEFAYFLEGVGGFKRNKEDDKIHIVPAGKNFGSFDKLFLERLPYWNRHIHVGHRVVDPGPMYLDIYRDEKPPNLEECIRRAGVKASVTHNAMDDAEAVVKVIRAAKMKG